VRQADVERYPWYHTLELGDGVVTKGMFDHRPHLQHYPIPADLTGKRCLDVSTMDGYWAVEVERRGAASVTALDLEDPEELDWPASLRAGHDKSMDETKAERFALAKGARPATPIFALACVVADSETARQHAEAVLNEAVDRGLGDVVAQEPVAVRA
jgi:hypothetical protein